MPLNFCQPENFGLQYPSLVGPAGPPGGPGTYVNSLAELRLLDPVEFTQGYIVNVAGHSQPNDGGGGLFEYDATNVSADNDGTIVEPFTGFGRWLRIYSTWVSIEWFGAKPNGVTDNRAAIQATIDFAASINGTVVIPTGEYAFGMVPWGGTYGGLYSFNVPTGTAIVGLSQAGSVLKLLANSYNGIAFFRIFTSEVLSPISDVILREFTLDGNRANQPASTNGGNIIFETGDRILIQRVKSINANGQGIQIRGSLDRQNQDLTIDGNYVQNCSFIGIQVAQFIRLAITDNVILDTDDNGIDIYGNNGGSGISTGQQFIIRGNQIKNSTIGIFHETVRQGVTSDNIVDSCVDVGITGNRINGDPNSIQICDNLVTDTPIGLRITGDTTGICIITNNFEGFDSCGISMGQATAIGAGNVGYIDIKYNTLKPTDTTIPIIGAYPNQLAFVSILGNTVNSNAHDLTKLFDNHSITTVAVQVMEFFGLVGLLGPQLKRETGTVLALSCQTADISTGLLVLAGPGHVDIDMTTYACGTIRIGCTGAGSKSLQVFNFVNDGTTLVKQTSGVEVVNPGVIVTYSIVGLSIRVTTALAAQINVHWGIETLLLT